MVLKARLERAWSFSGLAIIVRICLMYYADVYTLLEHSERDWVHSQKQRGILAMNAYFLNKGGLLSREKTYIPINTHLVKRKIAIT